MALKDRIDIINGLTNTAATVTNLLNLEAPSYIRYIPDDIVRQFTSDSTDSGSGVTIGSGRFVYGHKSGRRAQLRDSAEKAALDDANSLHLATALTPACFVENGKAFVKPSGGTVVAVLPTTLNSSSDDTISFLPASLNDAVQIKVAWRLLAYSFYARAFPYTAPTSPTIEYIPAGYSAMATAAFAALPAAPTYTTQAIDAAFATQLAEAFGTVPTAPVYSAPSIDGGYATEMAKVLASIGSAPAVVNATIGADFATELAKVMAAIPTGPVYTPPTLNADFSTVLSDTETALDADDVEIAMARLNKGKAWLEEYQSKIQDAQNTFVANNADFQAEVQKVVKDIEVSLQKCQLVLSQYQTDIQENAQTLEANVVKFNADAQKILKDIDVALQKSQYYLQQWAQAIDSAKVTFTSNLEKFRGDLLKVEKTFDATLQRAALYVQEFSNRIQNQQGVFASNKALFDAEVVKRQADIQALVEKYRLDAQQETSVDLQNQAQKASVELQNYSLELQRYQQTFNAWVAEKQGQQQMLNNLLQQHEAIMAQYMQPQKAVQKTYKNQPLEAEA